MIMVRDIQREVATHYGLPLTAMTMRDGLGSRSPRYSHPRQLAMALCRDLIESHYGSGNTSGFISISKIGRLFGNRDHATVIHAIRQVEQRCKTDTATREAMRHLTRRLLPRGGVL